MAYIIIIIYNYYIYGTVHAKMSCFIYMERSTKIWPLWIYVYNIKPQIAISYELLILSTCYVHHFIPHHFYIRKYNLVSCTTGVPTLRGPISKGVPNGHIFRWERSNRLMYVEGFCRYWVVLLHFWSSCDPLIVQIYRYSAVHTELEVHCTYILQLIKWVELTGGGVGWGGGICLSQMEQTLILHWKLHHYEVGHLE